MSPRYIVLVGTSVAPSQHSPSQRVERGERVREHGDDVIAGRDAQSAIRVGPAQIRLVELASCLVVAVDVQHRGGVGLVAGELGQEVWQHELAVQRCPPIPLVDRAAERAE